MFSFYAMPSVLPWTRSTLKLVRDCSLVKYHTVHGLFMAAVIQENKQRAPYRVDLRFRPVLAPIEIKSFVKMPR